MKHVFTSVAFLRYARRGALLLALGAAGPAAWGQSFGPVTQYATAFGTAFGIASGDVNGDGRLDIVTVSSTETSNNYSLTTGAVGVLLGQANGGFAACTSYFLSTTRTDYYYRVALGDVNGDGYPDIVTTRNTSPGNVMVLLGQGNGTFGPQMNRTM